MKLKRNDSAISEILSTVLLLGIAIGLFSVVYSITIPTQTVQSNPSVTIFGYIQNENIILEHYGGESISTDSYILLEICGNNTRVNISTPFLNDINNNTEWDIGEKILYDTEIQGLQVEATVVNQPSNSILFTGILQKGLTKESPLINLNTSVNSISPYLLSFSSLNLNATGDSSLDNVSLFYRWSEDNSTWGSFSDDTFTGFGRFNGSQSTVGSDFNVPTYNSLVWSDQDFDSDYYSYDSGNNSRILCDVSGDYLISLSLPIRDLTLSGVNNNRVCIEAGVFVNGIRKEVGTTRSSFLRGEGGGDDHFYSSDNMVVLISDVQAGEYIEIKVRGDGDTAESVGSGVDMFSLYIQCIPSSDAIFFANATQSTASSNPENLNQGTSNTFSYDMEWNEIIKDTGFTHSDSSNPQSITINSAGYYYVSVLIPLEKIGGGSRTNVGGAVEIDGVTVTGGTFMQGYIRRNSEGNFKSSIQWAGLVKTTSSNQILSIGIGVWGATGVVETNGMNATLFVRKIETGNTRMFYSTATQVSGSSPNDWNPDTTEYILWKTAIENDNAYYNHTADNQNIAVKEDGYYLLTYNSPQLYTTGQREAPQFTIYVNGVAQDGSRTGSTYIRDAGGHEESTTSLAYLMLLNTSDNISIGVVKAMTNTNTLVDDNDEAIILLEYKGSHLSTLEGINWTKWNDSSNPDSTLPYSWEFDFPNGTGYYEFYSIGTLSGTREVAPSFADAICYYNPS